VAPAAGPKPAAAPLVESGASAAALGAHRHRHYVVGSTSDDDLNWVFDEVIDSHFRARTGPQPHGRRLPVLLYDGD
jgi:hypothetical protein